MKSLDSLTKRQRQEAEPHQQEQHPAPVNDITFQMDDQHVDFDENASVGSANNVDGTTSEKFTVTSRSGSEKDGSSKELAGKESRAVFRSKLSVLFVLLLAAVSVSTMAYRLTKSSEKSAFEHDVSFSSFYSVF